MVGQKLHPAYCGWAWPMSQLGQTRKSPPARVTSAYASGADFGRANRYARSVPNPDISLLFDHLVRTGDQRWRDINTERLGCSEIDC
jgi:hypothetical protein